MARRSKQRRMEEEELQLYDVLEPYDDRAYHTAGDPLPDEQDAYYEPQGDYYDQQPDADYEMYGQYPEAGYADYLEEPEAYDENENHMGVAVHVADVFSSLIGVLVILILVAMLLTLVDWLRTDIMHSFLLLQSGIS